MEEEIIQASGNAQSADDKTVEITKTCKGKSMAVVAGYSFYFERKTDKKNQTDNRYYWKCSSYYTHLCPARLVTRCVNEEHIYDSKVKDHTHLPSPTKKSRLDALNLLRTKAKQTRDKPSKLINEAKSSLSRIELASLPSNSAQRQIIHYARRSSSKCQVEPSLLDDFILPGYLQVSPTGEEFVIADSNLDGQRVISFGTRRSLILLAMSEILIIDGNIIDAPTSSYHFYTLFGLAGTPQTRRAFPMAFALMSCKTTALYRRLFQDLKGYFMRERIEFAPKCIMIDFEKTAIRACSDEFILAKIHGCYFHFGQIIFKAISSHGLKLKFGTDAEFAVQIRKLIALAFLQPFQIQEAFESLVLRLPDDEATSQFIEWFRQNYIIKIGAIQSNSASFPPEFWSIIHLVDHGLLTLQNSIEAWHRRFKILVGASPPGILTLVNKFREENHFQINIIDKVERGEEDHAAKSFTSKEAKLRSIIETKDSRSLDDYLSLIGQHIKNLIDV